MFPNEDDIKANIIYKDIINNYAILNLKRIPIIKMQPFIFSNNDLHQEGKTVYTIGYPWTNANGRQAYFNKWQNFHKFKE